MRISDWSSDVCSSDLDPTRLDFHVAAPPGRYIWLRLVLSSDGRRTPAIEALEVVFGGERKLDLLPAERAEESRVGTEAVGTCRSRWERYHHKKSHEKYCSKPRFLTQL